MLQPSAQSMCFVNPDNPAESVMVLEYRKNFSLIALIPTVFVVIGIIGIASVIKRIFHSTR